MKNELILVGDVAETEVTLVASAIEVRDKLLVEAQGITAVADAFDAECAAGLLRSISTATKDVENARKTVKAPVLELGKRIDGCAKDFSDDLLSESERISRMLGTYEAAERRKQQEAERKARREEQLRLAEAEQAVADGDETAMDSAVSDIVAIRNTAASKSHRPEGTSVRETWQFEVEDIETLYKAAPHLCTVVPDNTAIRAAIKKSQRIPGLRIWKEAKSYIR